jgi:hypothetical protein
MARPLKSGGGYAGVWLVHSALRKVNATSMRSKGFVPKLASLYDEAPRDGTTLKET